MKLIGPLISVCLINSLSALASNNSTTVNSESLNRRWAQPKHNSKVSRCDRLLHYYNISSYIPLSSEEWKEIRRVSQEEQFLLRQGKSFSVDDIEARAIFGARNNYGYEIIEGTPAESEVDNSYNPPLSTVDEEGNLNIELDDFALFRAKK